MTFVSLRSDCVRFYNLLTSVLPDNYPIFTNADNIDKLVIQWNLYNLNTQ